MTDLCINLSSSIFVTYHVMNVSHTIMPNSKDKIVFIIYIARQLLVEFFGYFLYTCKEPSLRKMPQRGYSE